MTTTSTLVLSAITLALIMTAAWQMQRVTGNNGWADVFWSFGIGIAGISALLVSSDIASHQRKYLVAMLLGAWSLRLGLHILFRTLKSHDDPRYAKLRKDWGAAADIRMFFFLQSQAFAGIILVVCTYIAAGRPDTKLDLADYLGAAIMLFALAGETIADRQLQRFSNDPANRGRICNVGLWSWSRHPNYFFEWLGWISYGLIGVGIDGDYVYGWLSFAAPLLMYVLLRHVSGVPPLEEHMQATRGNAFRDYQTRTNIFFPAPPKREVGQ